MKSDQPPRKKRPLGRSPMSSHLDYTVNDSIKRGKKKISVDVTREFQLPGYILYDVKC